MQFELPRDVNLATVFRMAHHGLDSRNLHIASFSVSQNNLDNVFVNFVREQGESSTCRGRNEDDGVNVCPVARPGWSWATLRETRAFR
jgi:hypothetical protein